MFFESLKRVRLAHSSRKGLARVMGAGAAVIASMLPAARAARVDVMQALRSE